MNFKRYHLLREMPYYELSDGNIYDLEMELYANDLEGFQNKLISLLKGEEHTDKRGNKIQLQSPSDIRAFLEWLSTNNQVLLFLKVRHKIADVVSYIDQLVNQIEK